MLRSFSEFKFFQSFRVPVEEADEIRFLVEGENDVGSFEYISDAKLIDVSIYGISFTTKQRIAIEKNLRISIHFKKIHLDLDGKVIRSFTDSMTEETLLYGCEFEEGEEEEVKRFLEQYIYSFSSERLRDCMIQMSLTDRYSTAAEGLEMFSLLLSLFKDMTNFAEKDDFVDTILEEVVRILNAQRATVFLVNPDTNELEAIAALGVEKSLLKFDYRKGIAGSVFTTGVSLNINTSKDKTRFSSEIDEVTGYKTKSIICNPVYNREDKVIGVVEVLNKRNESRFSVEDEKVMKVVALVFSSVFHNYNPLSKQSAIRRFSSPVDRKHILIGKSKEVMMIRNSIVKTKDLDSFVYIYGERGVGKSLLSRIIHSEGKRGLNPYNEFFCGGQDNKVVAEGLFGSDKEAGILEQSNAGTLLLRDIFLLPLDLQKQLYEVLVTKKLPNPNINLNLEIRIIATSSRNLEKIVVDGGFNKDLFDLINQAFIVISPLRKRQEDIKDLINHFLKLECQKQGLLLKSFSPAVLKQFEEYDWPGNIQELKTAVERTVLYNPKNHIISNINNMTTPIFDTARTGNKLFEDIPFASDHKIVLKDRMALIERQMILTEIKRNNGNKSKAARQMGISREALRKKLMLSQDILDALEGYKATSEEFPNEDDEKKSGSKKKKENAA